MPERGRLKRGLWVGIGTAFLAVGLIGVVIPLLPTTPLLILAAFCYARGSERLHNWLLEQRYLGIYLRAYERGEGVSQRTKILSLLMLWGAMGVTIFFFVEDLLLRGAIIVVGLAVSLHILYLKGR